MKKKKQAYTFFHKASAIFLILALAWLTVSVAFLPTSQSLSKKDKIENSKALSDTNNEEESSNNNNNTTEEKVPSSNSLSEEYLHDHHQTHYFYTVISTFHKLENADTYTAFHGELLVPPPNRA